MSTFHISVEGTHAKGLDVGHEDADAVIDALAEHLKAQGHTPHHISLSHGALKGGSRVKEFDEKVTIAPGEVGDVKEVLTAQ